MLLNLSPEFGLGCGGWYLPDGPMLFAVLARRKGGNGGRAVLLANDPGKAALIAAKVSHYGRYSLLLFANGRNIVKMTGDPAVSPLGVTFDKESGA